MVHLELPLEVGDGRRPFTIVLAPQRFANSTTSPRRRPPDVVLVTESLLQEGDALVDGEHRLFVARLADDSDDDAVEDHRGPADDVQVPERDRVVAAGANRRA